MLKKLQAIDIWVGCPRNVFDPDELISPDHIFPVKKITEMPGFDSLTTDQKKAIIRDEVGVGNIQPLPSSMNSSKRDRLGEEWKTYKGQELDQDYMLELAQKQFKLEKAIQDKIDEFNLGN